MSEIDLTSAWQGWGPTVLRLAVGAVFVAHGWQKFFDFGIEGTAGAFEGMGIPFASASALVVATVELGGGLALITGLLTRLAALGLSAVMLVALLQVHLPAGFFLPDGIEFVFVLLGANLSLLVTGPGRLALDSRIRELVADASGDESRKAEAEAPGTPVGSGP